MEKTGFAIYNSLNDVILDDENVVFHLASSTTLSSLSSTSVAANIFCHDSPSFGAVWAGHTVPTRRYFYTPTYSDSVIGVGGPVAETWVPPLLAALNGEIKTADGENFQDRSTFFFFSFGSRRPYATGPEYSAGQMIIDVRLGNTTMGIAASKLTIYEFLPRYTEASSTSGTHYGLQIFNGGTPNIKIFDSNFRHLGFTSKFGPLTYGALGSYENDNPQNIVILLQPQQARELSTSIMPADNIGYHVDAMIRRYDYEHYPHGASEGHCISVTDAHHLTTYDEDSEGWNQPYPATTWWFCLPAASS